MEFGHGKKLAKRLDDDEDDMDDRQDEKEEAQFEDADQDGSIFHVQKLEWQPTRDQGELISISVGSNVLLLATSNNTVIRWNLATDAFEEIAVAKKTDDHRIYKVFIDPSGMHALISMYNGQNYYLRAKKPKAELLSKVKNVMIESVAWNGPQATPTSTKNFLIGSNKGLIYECCIEDKEKQFKKVYELSESDRDRVPISGLHVELFPSGEEGKGGSDKFFVMAATPRRLYQFIGGPTFEAMFLKYPSNPAFRELPGALDYSALSFFSRLQAKVQTHAAAETCAWMTGAGVFYGNLVFGSQDNAADRVVDDGKLLPYPEFQGPSKDAYGKPLALVLTEFHFLILYPGRLSAVNRLSEEIVYEDTFDASQYGTMQGLCPDPRKGTVWMFSDRMVFEVEIDKEQRDIWKLYLEKGEYANSLTYCENQAQREHVYNAQADFYFTESAFELAATSYAKTQRSFEEITLKFLGVSTNTHKQGRNALQKYLLSKLDNLAPADLTQATMICTWLTEIFLDNLNVLQPEPVVTIHASNEQKVSQTAKNYNDYEEQLQEFKEFLFNFSDCLNRDTTFELISSHGRIEELLYYAEMAGELEWLIGHHIQQGQYQTALSFLEKHDNPGKCVNLYYKFCPALMHKIPKETIDVLIGLTPLDPAKLIPALMRYKEDPTGPNHAIRYLEHVIRQGCKDPAVHNYLVSLYAKQRDEAPLLRFIEQHKKEPIYDYKYALRLCHDEDKARACVGIYTAMGQFQEAVRLGLEVAPNLAKKVVEQCTTGDEEEKRRLWLIIAKHIIQTGNDMKAAMGMIKDCNLKLEDILPYFPDFARIGDFKDEICASLESYNKTIEGLKSEMGQYTASAERIREDTHELRSRSGFVTANQKCDLCAQPVLIKQFFLFPCTHVFHIDCVTNYVRRFLSGRREKQHYLDQVESELRAGELKALDHGQGSEVDHETRLIEVFASSQCAFCGDIMIEEVREAFIQPSEYDEVRSWKI